MVIKKIQLKDFRSYQKAEFDFGEGLTLITGPNAAGKTNLLEAVYLLATGKSFRASLEREMISARSNNAIVKAQISARFEQSSDREGEGQEEDTDMETIQLEVFLSTGGIEGQPVPKKRYRVNGVPRRQMDFVGNLRAVLFRPEDLDIITGSPSGRRRYLDAVLEMTDREYRRASLSYQKGLRQRNKLLEQIREEGRPRSVLYFWDKLLIENGRVISEMRRELIGFFNRQMSEGGTNPGSSTRIEPGSSIQIEYDESVISEKRLEQYADGEVAAGMTLVGPHRDDFSIRARGREGGRAREREGGRARERESGRAGRSERENSKQETETLVRNLAIYGSRGEPFDIAQDSSLEGRNLAIYGSRGEQRMAVLRLKLAELEYVSERSASVRQLADYGEARPILLLDDIFSELDREHREEVLAAVGRQQTLITTTDLRTLPSELIGGAKVIELAGEF